MACAKCGAEGTDRICAVCWDASRIKLLLDVDDGLTDWEVRFAEDLSRTVVDAKRTMTPKQRDKVDDILERLGL